MAVGRKISVKRLSRVKKLNDEFSYGKAEKKLANRILEEYGKECGPTLEHNPFLDLDIFMVLFHSRTKELAGYVWIGKENISLSEQKPLNLHHFFVAKAFRRQGLGAEFLTEVFSEFDLDAIGQPNELMWKLLKKVQNHLPMIFLLPTPAIGDIDASKDVILMIPADEYESFLTKYGEWKAHNDEITSMQPSFWTVLEYFDQVEKVFGYIVKKRYLHGASKEHLQRIRDDINGNKTRAFIGSNFL